jgi:predicted transcriptional regulator of viral defense system
VTREQAIQVLAEWDRKGRCVFAAQDLARLFPDDSPGAFNKGLDRLVRSRILNRACRGVYVNPHAASRDSYLLERIALIVRRGEYNYVSLESMLSELGVISQIPLDRLTVMTTGRKGEYRTPFGVIEFTHTKRPVNDILKNTFHAPNRPLRITSAQTAWRDLKRVGRNIHPVDQ